MMQRIESGWMGGWAVGLRISERPPHLSDRYAVGHVSLSVNTAARHQLALTLTVS
jgi:hypothetical protein